MFKFSHLLLIIIAYTVLCSCEQKYENPGDFALKSNLEIVQIYDTLGNTFPVEVLRSIDTTYLYPRITRDTLKDTSGNPILDNQNKLQITIDTTYVPGEKTARYIELDTIVIGSTRNELHIDLETNARWQAPSPNFGTKVPWFVTQTGVGGGNGTIKAKISLGLASKRRPILARQFIFTRDSLVMYKLTFDQKAQNEQ
ncbi:MAG: hypothetical protein PHZ12_06850 [Paludibacter sp.]|nr:hypothetical protein [Paludibacter sp.]MDD4428820.1 hypothetical protein [Paludibacter sp.]